MKKETEIRVLMVEPNEHPKEYLLENTLSAMQAAVGGLITSASCSMMKGNC